MSYFSTKNIHHYKTFWFTLNSDKFQTEYDTQLQLTSSSEEAKIEATKKVSNVEMICDATLKGLYFQRNIATNEAWYYFKIQRGHRDIIKETFTSAELTSKANFTNRLLDISPGVWWTGSDKQLQTILKNEINPERLKEVKTTDFIGYSKEYSTYLFKNHAVYKGKLIHINNNDYFNAGKNELKTLATTPIITLSKEPFQPHWWQDNFKINGEKGLIILAWWAGSYFAEQIREVHSSYPFLEYVGQAGSGKSSYIDFLWRLSGRNDRKEGINPNSSSIVAVHRSMAQVSNLPIVFLEGDRKSGDKQQKQKFDWDELKDAFNGQNIRSRGLKTSGNETYEPPFRGAIMISQNDPMQASEAILSRTLQIIVDMKGHTYEKKMIANKLYGIEFDDANRFMTHCLINEEKILNTFFEKCSEIEKHYHQCGITHTRIALCHAQIAAMIEALAKHVLNEAIDLEEIVDSHEMLEQMALKRMEDISDDHIFVKQFWEAFEYVNSSRTGAFNLNYYHDKDPNYVAINLNEVYQAAARKFQSLPDINDMRTLLRSSRKYKFIELNRQVKTKNHPAKDENSVLEITERNVKCWIFTNPYQQH